MMEEGKQRAKTKDGMEGKYLARNSRRVEKEKQKVGGNGRERVNECGERLPKGKKEKPKRRKTE